MKSTSTRLPWRVDLSVPVYVASRPEHHELSSDCVFSKLVTAEHREIEEKVERTGPFRRKQVARFNPIETVVTEKFSVLTEDHEELLSGRPVNPTASAPGGQATQWVALERRGSEWVVRPVVQWVDLKKPAAGADDDAERKLRELKTREAADKRKFDRRFLRAAEAAAETGPGGARAGERRAKRRRAGEEGEGAVDSAVAMQGVRDEEGAWEGEEGFSDDDELMSDDEAQRDEEAVDVEDEDHEKNKEEPSKKNKDMFAMEVAKIINNEKEKTVEARTQDALFDEQAPPSDLSDSEAEEPSVAPAPAAGPVAGPVGPRVQFTSKQDEVRLRLVDLFFRNEYTLDVATVSKHFAFTRDQPEYKILYDAIKQCADLVGRTLHLKPHLRR